jgi:hypothetical protein
VKYPFGPAGVDGVGVVGGWVVGAGVVVVGAGVVVVEAFVVEAFVVGMATQESTDLVYPALHVNGQLLLSPTVPIPVKNAFGFEVQLAVDTHPALHVYMKIFFDFQAKYELYVPPQYAPQFQAHACSVCPKQARQDEVVAVLSNIAIAESPL